MRGVMFLIVCLGCINTAKAQEDVFKGRYRLQPVLTGRETIHLKLPIENRHEHAVERRYIRASCSCTEPSFGGKSLLKPGDRQTFELEIRLPKTESLLRVSLVVSGHFDFVHKNGELEKIEIASKKDDVVEIGRYEIEIPVVEPFRLLAPGKSVEVRPGQASYFQFESRKPLGPDNLVIETSRDDVAVECVLQEDSASHGSEAYLCTILGLNSLRELAPRPKNIELVFSRKLHSEIGETSDASVELFRESLALEFISLYRVLPKVVSRRSGRFSLTLDCSNGDAEAIESQIEIWSAGGEKISDGLWSTKVLSESWVRISLDASSEQLAEVRSIEIRLPKKGFRSFVSVK